MSNFLPRHINDIQGWIPETDIDGLDAGALGVICVINDRFLKMLNRVGLPFKILGPKIDYHGIRQLVGFSWSEVENKEAWTNER